jgi:hypothetical protein
MRYVVAHQGGWDEILYMVVPVAAALMAVRWAERRRGAREEDADGEGDDPEAPAP